MSDGDNSKECNKKIIIFYICTTYDIKYSK